ncbi:MAG: Uma2 family endonuclease [Anaerolineae bacterium]|nr:Uma2 family endonuclease [Anaerolineae bacterium]
MAAVRESTHPVPITETYLMSLGADFGVEVVNEEIVHMAPAGVVHGSVSMIIGLELGNFVRQNKLGRVFADQTTYVLEGTPGDIKKMRAPDKSFVAAENLPDELPEGYFYQAPDLAVEVVSPTEGMGDVMSKVNDYLRAGTKAVWVVIPKTRQVMVYTPGGITLLGEGQTLEGGALLPEFAVPVEALFA